MTELTTRLRDTDDAPTITEGDTLDVTVNTSERKTLTVTAEHDLTDHNDVTVSVNGQVVGNIKLIQGYSTQFDADGDINDDVIGIITANQDRLGIVEAIHPA